MVAQILKAYNNFTTPQLYIAINSNDVILKKKHKKILKISIN